jgi:hypothetical protein
MFSYLHNMFTNTRGKLTAIMEKLTPDNIEKLYHYSETLHDIQEGTEKKQKNWNNHRLHANPQWEYMTKDIIEKYKKIVEESSSNPPYYDITYRSRYNNVKIMDEYKYISIFGRNNHKIIMADYLMFNPFYKLDYELVDRLLPYCKIRIINDYKYKVDGWVYEYKPYGKPSYHISYDNSDYDTMDFIKTDEEKRLAVRLFIQVMNETPDEYVNFHNYHVIAKWYGNNDNYLSSSNTNMQLFEIYKTNKPKESSNDIIPKEDLIVPVEDKLKREDILNLLVWMSKFGTNDIHEFGLSKELAAQVKSDCLKKYQAMVPNTKSIDLTKYYHENGSHRTRSLIEELQRITKYKINCSNYLKPNGEPVTKEELLVALYNSCLPFGMGIMQGDDKPLTLTEAQDILAKMTFIDYYRGTAIKTSFSHFPIMDFEKFDKYNGSGKFMQCVNQIQSNDASIQRKVAVTDEYVVKEVIRMNTL